MNAIDPMSVTFMLPPAAFQAIVPYAFSLEDEWAFKIPLQILSLRQSPKKQPEVRSGTTISGRNIFGLRPWCHMIFNEGSSVQAYDTYEFFSKCVPSVLHPKGSTFIPPLPFLSDIFPQLVSLDYIAVFPIHYAEMSHVLTGCFRKLERLRVRFSPTLSNNVLDDPNLLGRCSRSDLWSELKPTYTGLMKMLRDTSGSIPLRDFTFLDYSNAGVREIVEDHLKSISLGGWRPEGEGQWIRDMCK